KRAPPGVLSGQPAAFGLLTRAYMGDREAALAVLTAEGLGISGHTVRRPGVRLPSLIRAARGSGLGLRGLWSMFRESRSMSTRSPIPRPGRPNPLRSWTALFVAVEALVLHGERSQAAKLYPLVLESLKTGTILRNFDSRLIDTIAGIAAAAGADWPRAEAHFQTALRRTEELPHIIEQPEIRRFYARMLLDRNAPGDREKARGLLTEAIEMYGRLGMPKHVEMAEALLREV